MAMFHEDRNIQFERATQSNYISLERIAKLIRRRNFKVQRIFRHFQL